MTIRGVHRTVLQPRETSHCFQMPAITRAKPHVTIDKLKQNSDYKFRFTPVPKDGAQHNDANASHLSLVMDVKTPSSRPERCLFHERRAEFLLCFRSTFQMPRKRLKLLLLPLLLRLRLRRLNSPFNNLIRQAFSSKPLFHRTNRRHSKIAMMSTQRRMPSKMIGPK